MRAKVWRYPGPGGWHFVTLSARASGLLRHSANVPRAGWGSIRVRAKLGASEWATSLFPAKGGRYVLAIKAAVRRAEAVAAGDLVRIGCKLI